MDNNNFYHTPRVTFASVARETRLPLYLNRYADDVLLSDMRKAAEKEEYDVAIIFRDELIRRGKLQNKTI